MRYNDLVPARAGDPAPHAERLRLAVAAYLARFKGTPATTPAPICAMSRSLPGTPTRVPLCVTTRARKNLDRHPNYILPAYMASSTTFPPLPGDRCPSAGYPMPDLRLHLRLPARQHQRGPNRALPPSPSRSTRHPLPVNQRHGPCPASSPTSNSRQPAATRCAPTGKIAAASDATSEPTRSTSTSSARSGPRSPNPACCWPANRPASAQPGTWTLQAAGLGKPGMFVATSVTAGATIDPGATLTFILTNINVNPSQGLAMIEIEESADAAQTTATLALEKSSPRVSAT
jgi:hypothetical protein